MKILSKEKNVLIRKLIGLGSAIFCLVLMFLKFINYTSISEVTNSNSIIWDDGISLFSLLFSDKAEVLATPVSYLREIFVYGNVIMWISFILVCISQTTSDFEHLSVTQPSSAESTSPENGEIINNC